MRTDKQVFRIFQAAPEWIFELTQLESPGGCELRSFTLKELERRADGLVVPFDTSKPLTVVEFQFQRDENVYIRAVREMAAAQEQHQMRAVEGLIIFAYNGLDPKTEPWTRVVRSFSIDELLAGLESRQPGHPLVAVFKPMSIQEDAALVESAAQYYRQIRFGELDDAVKCGLLEVFISWLEQRFRERTKQEIEAMLVGELPDLEETQSGKDLIAIGEKRGEQRGEQRGKREGKREGKIASILVYLEAKHKRLPHELRKAISMLTSSKADSLSAHLHRCKTLRDVELWLERNA